MIYVYISIGVILGILLLCFFFAFLIHRKTFGKRWNPDGIVKYYTKEEFIGLESEKVEIPTKRGILRGFFYKYPQKAQDKILVFAHGMWGSHQAYLQEIELLAQAGFTVLGFDYYGTESSDGKNIVGLANSLKSLECAIGYVKKNFPNSKIYVMGHSWGGFAASSIAKFHPDLAGIVSMSGFISSKMIYKHLLPKPIHFVIPFLILFDSIKCGGYSYTKVVRVLKNSKVPTLILHSKDDTMVPYLASTAVIQKKVSNPRIHYHIVDGKRHNPDYKKEALDYAIEVHKELQQLKTEEERLKYRKNINYHKLGEIDLDVFSVITDFLNS